MSSLLMDWSKCQCVKNHPIRISFSRDKHDICFRKIPFLLCLASVSLSSFVFKKKMIFFENFDCEWKLILDPDSGFTFTLAK